MASNLIEISVDWGTVKDALRDMLITGGYGKLWEQYCYDNNIPADIKLGFLDFLADVPEKIFNDDDD
jgi:hypothetical protein